MFGKLDWKQKEALSWYEQNASKLFEVGNGVVYRDEGGFLYVTEDDINDLVEALDYDEEYAYNEYLQSFGKGLAVPDIVCDVVEILGSGFVLSLDEVVDALQDEEVIQKYADNNRWESMELQEARQIAKNAVKWCRNADKKLDSVESGFDLPDYGLSMK